MSIFKQVENSEDQVEIWTLSTNDFDEWEEGKVFIEESRNYQVLFIWFSFLKIEYLYKLVYIGALPIAPNNFLEAPYDARVCLKKFEPNFV